MEINGTVTSGFGKAAYFLGQDFYKSQFKVKCGFIQYPGTLNLTVPEKDLDKINNIRSKINDISISSDVIVGLPNETEEYFQQTIDTIQQAHLSFLHVFPYARKKHTVDYDKKNQVDAKVKKERVGRLTNLSLGLYNNYASSFVGKTVDVLFEKYEKGINKGHCSQYLNVELACAIDLTNQFVKVEVISVK